MPLKLNVNNENSSLDAVVLGIGTDTGNPGSNNPKAQFHLEQGTYPRRKDLVEEINGFEKVLIENGVKVFRPLNMEKTTQIFTRDLAFVVGEELFLSAMNNGRKSEREAISYLQDLMGPFKTTDLAEEKDLMAEGGDIVLTDETVFVGLSGRTNQKAFDHLQERFEGKKKAVQVKVVLDKNDHREHSLHLDCVFQPLGRQCAIVFEDGIKNLSKLYDNLDVKEENIFKVNPWQFSSLVTNVLSINPNTVIIEEEFIDLKYWLKERGFTVLEVKFREISKLGGLLRCATLPLRRI